MKQYIDFKKRRGLEVILSDAFSFMQIEYKSILQVALKISLYPSLLTIAIFVALVYYLENYSQFDIVSRSLTQLATCAFLIIILYIVLISVCYYYIQNYIENKGKIDVLQIKKSVFKNITKILSIGFIHIALVIIGTSLFIFPGIYMAVPLFLSTAVRVFTKSSIPDAIKESFSLVKGKWIETFLVLFVIHMILGAANFSMTFGVSLILKFIEMITGGASPDPENTLTSFYSGLAGLVALIIYIILGFVFALFSAVATVFLFFNLHEQKYQTGTIEQIDNLGN